MISALIKRSFSTFNNLLANYKRSLIVENIKIHLIILCESGKNVCTISVRLSISKLIFIFVRN